MIYELVLAQTLSTTLGNTVLRYNITIALYMASLGCGALLVSWLKKKIEIIHGLIWVELILALIGALFPLGTALLHFKIINLSQVFQISQDNTLFSWTLTFINHAGIIIIGLLSGIELPFLMELAERLKKKSQMIILAVDYFGSLLAAVCFPLILLPWLGLFKVAYLVAFLNWVVAILLMIYYKQGSLSKITTGVGVLIVILSLLIFQSFIDHKLLAPLFR